MADGTERFYARNTDPSGRCHIVEPPVGESLWAEWGGAFTSTGAAQTEARRLS